MRSKFLVLIITVFVVSCDFFDKSEDQPPVARVNEVFLYHDDIKELITPKTSKEDSILIVQNFINHWATKQLLVDGALLNLSESKQESFNKLVEQYKTDLYTNAYMEALVKRSVDTVVAKHEAEKYYTNNKEAFKLNEELIKFRYIHLNDNLKDFNKIKDKFKHFDAQDKKELDSISIQFNSYSLNDSIWVKFGQVLNKMPVVKPHHKQELLKKSNFVQLKDSLGVYLVQITDVLLRNETAPLEYVKPTIDQIVINKRKLDLIRQIETDITKDAIKNKQFEIYK